jgi:hypothetical protein
LLLLFCFSAFAQDTKMGEGADLQVFGRGASPGQFELLRDITFDAQGNLYALDGGEFQKEAKSGNFRVQKFDASGKFISEFSVWNEAWGKTNNPQRLAVDNAGNIYVTQPNADAVPQFSPDGKLLQNFVLPRATAIARYGNGVAVVADRNDSIMLLPEKLFHLKRNWNMCGIWPLIGPITFMFWPQIKFVDLVLTANY